MIFQEGYKQNIWADYNRYIDRYHTMNDSFSVNCRLIHLDTDESVYDNIGGALENWSSRLTQLKWRVYENVPFFQNSPATTTQDANSVNATQIFNASIMFVHKPVPNDMLMFYGDPSSTVYHISDIRFHKTIENNLKLFEMDYQTTPISADDLYCNLNILSHEYYNPYNRKLYDFLEFKEYYSPVLYNSSVIIQEANSYFDQRRECYACKELNDAIRYIKGRSTYGLIAQLYTPISDTDAECAPEILPLLDKINRLKEILT